MAIEAMQDPNSVYFIYTSENPYAAVVSDKFDGEGYAEWKRSILLAFAVKNKVRFIDESLPKPALNHADYQAWDGCNSMVMAYLLRSLSPTIAKSVVFLPTARDIWKDLEERFSVTSGPQVYGLQQSLSEISQGDSSIMISLPRLR
ncbi:uncharacterized protein [Spinacia oleracea]|uniref:Retrotransposon Copia-like N-terminal domain-containing protein n=1 Tax=Spinacia oleracea TaxID=3562 RepID=A0A9R0KBF0_SPIOL|nr:uncharacterized protein LOC110803193 [Spinacia oleracea]